MAEMMKDNMGRMEIVEGVLKGEPMNSRASKASVASTALHETVATDQTGKRAQLENFIRKEFPGEGFRVVAEERILEGSKVSIDVRVNKFNKLHLRAELKRTAKFNEKGKWISGRKKQRNAYERSAKNNPDVPHLIIIPEGVYLFTKEQTWVTLADLGN